MTRTIALVTLAALLLSGTALAQGGRAAGRPIHGANLQTQTGAAMGPGGARAATQGAMHAPRGAGRFATPTPAAAPRGMGNAQAGAGPSGAIAARVEGVVASTLGLTQDELHALKLDGATIADIAAERGTPIETLEAAFLTARAEAVFELLAEGTINELQAERMTARGPEAFAELLARGVVGQGQNAGAAPRFADRSAANPGPQVAQPTPRMTPRGGHGGRW